MYERIQISQIMSAVGLAATVTIATTAAGCGAEGSDGQGGQEEQVDGTDWSLEELAAEEGLSIRIPSFEVAAQREEQSCYFMTVPDLNGGKDFWVDHVRTAMNPGSHHMNVFRVRTELGLKPDDGAPVKIGPYDGTVVRGHDDYQKSPCWASANWADWPLVANTQHASPDDPYTDWKLPDGVAMRFTPGERLMIQTHYVNTTTQPTPSGEGRVAINLYRTKVKEPLELGTLFATQQNLRICKSNPKPTYSGTCRFPGAVTITAANGHFHSRGMKFTMFTWDGRSLSHPGDDDLFYTSTNWSHPPMTTGIDRSVSNGGGLWWDCEYQWHEPIFGCDTVDEKDPEKAGDCCYTFGGNTDVGEHCNVFLYYYPKVADTDVFCN